MKNVEMHEIKSNLKDLNDKSHSSNKNLHYNHNVSQNVRPLKPSKIKGFKAFLYISLTFLQDLHIIHII